MENLSEFVTKNFERYAALRRDIHQYPEIGLEEERTSEIVAKHLTDLGYTVTRGMANTGVVGTLKCGDGGKTIGLRADMDALPMSELSGKPWTSKTDGKFHGCGHDGHTTTLLFAAEWLAKTRNFNGTVNLIFQPGEELLYGGRIMLEDGLFEQFPCDAIFALHNMPGLEKGSFHFRKGPMMASCDTLEIDVKGTGGHGAIPEKTVDAAIVACQIAITLQTIVSRNVTPFQPAVVSVGSIQSGNAPNIINEHATLKLSVRTLDKDVRALVLKRIAEIAEFQAKSFKATVEIKHINGCPATVNDDAMTDFAVGVARDLFGDSLVEANTRQLMGSEDFAFMLEANPVGTYCFIGSGEGPMVHNPAYDFNDEVLTPGVKYWCTLVERFFSKNN